MNTIWLTYKFKIKINNRKTQKKNLAVYKKSWIE